MAIWIKGTRAIQRTSLRLLIRPNPQSPKSVVANSTSLEITTDTAPSRPPPSTPEKYLRSLHSSPKDSKPVAVTSASPEITTDTAPSPPPPSTPQQNSRYLHSTPQASKPLAVASSSMEINADNSTSPIPREKPTLDLEDTEKIFALTPTSSLIRGVAVLGAITLNPLVDFGTRVLNPESMMMRFGLTRSAVSGAVRSTVYKQFCAGESAEGAAQTLTELWRSGLKGILNYGAEDADDSESCDRNLAGLLQTVEMITSLPESSRMSNLLRWEQKDSSFHMPWKLKTLPIFSSSSPLYHTNSMPEPLSDSEQKQLQDARQRLAKLCQRCSELNVPLLIDAEYTSVQPAIEYLTYTAAMQFNCRDDPIVWSTMQAYLRDSRDRLVQVVEAAEKEKISLGFKLVRGAYLTREAQLASSLGVLCPIHESMEQTHACYNSCASFLLERIPRGCISVMLATHNIESAKMAVAKANELEIRKGNPRLHFAQLMGMANSLSFGLANIGFQVSKYLPYGPCDEVIPYLIRRAEENKGFLSSSTLDRQLMWKELKRRFKAAFR